MQKCLDIKSDETETEAYSLSRPVTAITAQPLRQHQRAQSYTNETKTNKTKYKILILFEEKSIKIGNVTSL